MRSSNMPFQQPGFGRHVVDAHNLIPKIASDHVSSIKLLQGDGGVGTIKHYNFTSNAIKGKNYLKTRVEMVDEENFIYKYSFVKDSEEERYESSGIQVKFEVVANRVCICKLSSEFKTIGDYIPSDEESKMAKDQVARMFKGVEAYLIANPHAYA